MPNEPTDEITHMDRVDVDPRAHQATEDDEEQVLTDLYGTADKDGIYRGEGVDGPRT